MAKKSTKPFTNRIKEILDEKGMSQQELADIIGTNQSNLSKIMLDKRMELSLPMAVQISRALGKPVEEVFISNIQLSVSK